MSELTWDESKEMGYKERKKGGIRKKERGLILYLMSLGKCGFIYHQINLMGYFLSEEHQNKC